MALPVALSWRRLAGVKIQKVKPFQKFSLSQQKASFHERLKDIQKSEALQIPSPSCRYPVSSQEESDQNILHQFSEAFTLWALTLLGADALQLLQGTPHFGTQFWCIYC